MSSALIEAVSVTSGYGARDVLKDIDLSVSAGEMTGILGPNGSGKTTLLHTLTGILPTRKGQVRVAGRDVAMASRRWTARQIAVVPQKIEVTFPFTCFSLVLMGRYAHLDGWGDYTEEDRAGALAAMEETGVVHLADRPILEVSGGEGQMVTIARALAQETEILFLDEATSHLDVARKMEVFDLLARRNDSGATIVCVMHDLNLAALYCRRLVFLKEGRVVLDGPTEDVFNEANLSMVYDTAVSVSAHPITGVPQVHFVPARFCDHRPRVAGVCR